MRGNGLFGPWEWWRRASLLLIILGIIASYVFLNAPLGVAALIAMPFIAGTWKGLGMTDPTLGTYMMDTRPFKVAKFWLAYKMAFKEAIAPSVSIGMGPTSSDVDHDLEPGWNPVGRLSAFWALAAAIPLGMLDIFFNARSPFWGGSAVHVPLIATISTIGWYALIQTVLEVKRRQGDKEGIIAPEPIPATMITHVRADIPFRDLLVKSMGAGAIPAIILIIMWIGFGWDWLPSLIAIGMALSIVALVTVSRLMSKSYRANWQKRNDRRLFWDATFQSVKIKEPPMLLGEVSMPSLEQWEQQPHDEDEPYSAKIQVATFILQPGTTFYDFTGIEDRIVGTLGAHSATVTPVGDVDEETGEERTGTVGKKAFRIWWGEDHINMQDLWIPATDPYTRELGIRSMILPIISSLRGIGLVNHVSSTMVTHEESSVNILQVTVSPAEANVNLYAFMSKISDLQNNLGVPWVRAYQSDLNRNFISIMIGDGNPAEEGVRYKRRPSQWKRTISIANWSYYFHVNGISGDGGAPKLIEQRQQTDVVNELVFNLPPGLDFNAISNNLSSLKTTSGNAFMELMLGSSPPQQSAKMKTVQSTVRDEQAKAKDLTTRFTVLSARQDPLVRLFRFSDYIDQILTPRVPGKENLVWHPGVLANDQLAVDDFDSEEPHLLIAGSSGSGKSVNLHNLLVQLMHNNGPEDVRFWLVEPKIGLGRYRHVDNVERYVDSWNPTDDFFGNTADLFEDAVEEMKRRNQILSSHKKQPEKLEQARTIARGEGPLADGRPNPLMMPFLIIIVEECATVFADALSKEDRENQARILYNATRIAREGRSAGIYMVSLTQYPTNASIPSIIRNQMRRVGLATRNGMASRVIIDENGLEDLTIKGSGLTKVNRGYRQFRGFLLESGDKDQGQRNDVQDILAKLPGNDSAPSGSAWSEQKYIELPNPDEMIFKKWDRKIGIALDQAIENERKTKDVKSAEDAEKIRARY